MDIRQTPKAPQAFSGAPLNKSQQTFKWETGFPDGIPTIIRLGLFLLLNKWAKGARPVEVHMHVDDLKVYDFKGGDEPASG